MTAHLLCFVKNPVDWVRSDESDQFTLQNLDTSRVRKASAGIGTLYFYNVVMKYGVKLGSELFVSQETPIAASSPGSQKTIISINQTMRFPCSGIITGSEEGYLIAPTIRMDVAEGQDIALMLLSPRTTNHTIHSEKPTLTIPDDEANVIVSEEAGELRCTGPISSSKFQAARLVLNRNPHLPVYENGYNEELSKLTVPGEINVTWKPVSRIFEECVFVFHPGALNAADFESVAHWLGAPEDDFTGTPPPAIVVGDGPGTDYILRLVIDSGFRRSRSDETRVVVT